MPIWLSKVTFTAIKEHYNSVAEQNKKATTKKKTSFGPNIQPSFTSKGSKK